MAVVKDSVRERLAHVSHEYLILIDLGFDGTSDRDYEIQTAGAFHQELDFLGGRLGDTRKPDVCIYYGKDGMIIDNQGVWKRILFRSNGRTRCTAIWKNKPEQNEKINPNRWWKVFDEGVTDYRLLLCQGPLPGALRIVWKISTCAPDSAAARYTSTFAAGN